MSINNENPDLVIVNGTRIISRKVLESINATFINTHGGITPKYRGVFGGYWAVASKDRENFGVPTHLVDPGIDTVGILYQKHIQITTKDNITTYPYLMAGEGIRLMEKAILSFSENNLKTIQPQTVESKLFHTPTIWEYLYGKIKYGAK